MLPEIDLDVMVAAGFDRAAALIEDLRARVAFIHEYEPGRYRLHDLFRDFVRHQVEFAAVASSANGCPTLGQILEESGSVTQALRLYVDSHSSDDALRVLAAHGIRLLDSGFAEELESLIAASLGNAFEKSAVVMGCEGCWISCAADSTKAIARLRVPRSIKSTRLRGALDVSFGRAPHNSKRTPMDLLSDLLCRARDCQIRSGRRVKRS